jgi:hypothetical protein
MNDGFSGFIFREPSTAAIHIALLPWSFRSTFVVPSVAETAQVSRAPGQSDLHRDRFEWTVCLARSSSPPGPTTQ